jgi:hypothetical protein
MPGGCGARIVLLTGLGNGKSIAKGLNVRFFKGHVDDGMLRAASSSATAVLVGCDYFLVGFRLLRTERAPSTADARSERETDGVGNEA